MNTLKIILCFLLVAAVLPWAEGQFPRVCTTLASLKNKTCCPIPENFAEPCGSDGNRGTCEELIIRNWNYSYSHFEQFQTDDDRHNWPRTLYNRTCKCNGNFGGYDCGKCEFGYRGINCTKKKTLTRRNFLKLSAEEKDRYMRYINESKYFLSDYVVTTKFYDEISETVEAGKDPSRLFYNVSNHDLFTWMHYYSGRDTIYPPNVTKSDIDFAHGGQGFPTWHRLYLLAWERTLQVSVFRFSSVTYGNSDGSNNSLYRAQVFPNYGDPCTRFFKPKSKLSQFYWTSRRSLADNKWLFLLIRHI